jgi:hypothetical protein
MYKINRSDFLNLVGHCVSGIFANPTTGNISIEQYLRKSILHQVMDDIQQACDMNGIEVIEEVEK